MTGAWVAVDSGQTGLRLVSGQLSGNGPGFAYSEGDPVATITEAVRIAALDAGLSDPVDVACLGLTCYPDDPADRARLGGAILETLQAKEVRLCEDMVTAHAGALRHGDSVVLAAGTGVVCLAVGEDVYRKIGGEGHLLGDAGGGFAIGRAGLSAVLAAADGRGPATALTFVAEQHFGSVSGMAQRIHRTTAPVATIATFAPEVFAAADRQDPVAGEIVANAAADLACTIAAAVRVFDRTVPVACTGRVFETGELMMAPLRKRLADLAPAARLVPPDGDPLDGAVRLATGEPGRYARLMSVHHAAKSVPVAKETTVDSRVPFPPGALLVSCQAQPGNPLHGPLPMARMAAAAAAGGARAIRANGPADIAAICSEVDLPVLGINKVACPEGVFITPTFADAVAVVHAGASMVAIDGTARPRPGGESLGEQIRRIHEELGVPVMADVDNLTSGAAARAAGADVIATTLSGYTGGPVPDGPDVDLVSALVARLDCPVVAEGRYRSARDVRAAVDAGAYAVVVGTAITNPMAITTQLAKAMS
ncbi:putative N-acetylmannosamine-6-phosphate 2-epimerase [Amycolatopsis panacis]|uniref:N-acylglucosamine-6-phosphate 2-epimerase n=1 Tax=Amycolatopsis panacis TaxID=2340917 RepID=A0A419IAW1_9PSEU|nr:putative N-acetylmannosamine-6-phosphate 2-epimerase [Amycolatopsis panacis]RJQ91248.1 putative N-acetylmannosamine-6-phosphate 2-epimerase [Amycolatopsis panacis]